MYGKTVNPGFKLVKPILSMTSSEAHTRVIGLYRAFYRLIPYIVKRFDIPKSEQDVRLKIRELFYRNHCIEDVRVIDCLVIKGYAELKELKMTYQQKGHVMANWCPTLERQPTSFLGKFIEGLD